MSDSAWITHLNLVSINQNKRLARVEYLLDELITAMREHGEYIQDVERRNGYAGGFPDGLHSDKLDMVDDIDLEMFEENENEETEEKSQD